MAYISQDDKALINKAMHEVADATHTKYTLAIENYSTLRVTIKSSDIDLLGNAKEVHAYRQSMLDPDSWEAKIKVDWSGAINVNHHWLDMEFSGEALKFMTDLLHAINKINHDDSDLQRDHFDVGYYVDINLGTDKKSFQFTGNQK